MCVRRVTGMSVVRCIRLVRSVSVVRSVRCGQGHQHSITLGLFQQLWELSERLSLEHLAKLNQVVFGLTAE